MDFYSATLGLALVTAGAALGLALVIRRAARGSGPSAAPARGARGVTGAIAVIALVLVAIAGGSHLLTGHRPGYSSALGAPAFLREHPALLIAAALAMAALLVLRRASPERGASQ